MAYTGGKAGPGVAQQIVNQLPPHSVYVEPFAGHGAVARLKRPAHQTILCDLDRAIVDHWRNTAPGELPPALTVLREDALTFLAGRQWAADTLIYCDPPYLFEARAGGYRPRYTHEFGSLGQHKQLLRLLKRLPCMVAISGYWSALYADELRDWRAISFQAGTRGAPATEWLWMNYPEPLELHDYSHLGRNFRERERIKRKRERWRGRLRAMPAQERYALLAALDEVRYDGA